MICLGCPTELAQRGHRREGVVRPRRQAQLVDTRRRRAIQRGDRVERPDVSLTQLLTHDPESIFYIIYFIFIIAFYSFKHILFSTFNILMYVYIDYIICMLRL